MRRDEQIVDGFIFPYLKTQSDLSPKSGERDGDLFYAQAYFFGTDKRDFIRILFNQFINEKKGVVFHSGSMLGVVVAGGIYIYHKSQVRVSSASARPARYGLASLG